MIIDGDTRYDSDNEIVQVASGISSIDMVEQYLPSDRLTA
jgi:hypothetical protein